MAHEKKNEMIQLPPELKERVEKYLEEDSFGYQDADEFIRDAVRRHLETITEVNKVC